MESGEVYDALESHKEEAMKIVINAFNEGFMLGVKHANKAFGDTQDAVNEAVKLNNE